MLVLKENRSEGPLTEFATGLLALNNLTSIIVFELLFVVVHATRSAASRSLDCMTPGSIAFNRNVLLNVPFIADLQELQDRRQPLIDENPRRQNARGRHYDY